MFNKIFAELAAEAGKPERLMIDATHLKAHRTAASLLKRGFGRPMIHRIIGFCATPRCIGRTKGGLSSKLHAVCDGKGRPLVMTLTEGQMSDYRGAAITLPALPKTRELLADRGYDASWFRNALAAKEIKPCIPSKTSRRTPIAHDKIL